MTPMYRALSNRKAIVSQTRLTAMSRARHSANSHHAKLMMAIRLAYERYDALPGAAATEAISIKSTLMYREPNVDDCDTHVSAHKPQRRQL